MENNKFESNNSFTLRGYLCKDIEATQTQNGKDKGNIMLNVFAGKDENGNKSYDVAFVALYGKKVKEITESMGKGDYVSIEGKINSRFENGKYSTELVTFGVERILEAKKEQVEEKVAEQAKPAPATTKTRTPKPKAKAADKGASR